MRSRRELMLGMAMFVVFGALELGLESAGADAKTAKAVAVDAPKFVVDPLWPKPMPNHWILGSAVGVAVDAHDHVFVLNLPNSFNARTEIGASTTPPTGECCLPAPPVLELDPDGNVVGHWGGPGQGYDWPASPSGIAIDSKGNVWIGSGGISDTQILEFSHDGKFLMEAGRSGGGSAGATGARGAGAGGDTAYAGVAPTPGRAAGARGAAGGVQGPVTQPAGNSTSPAAFGGPAHIAFDEAANEVYVADGYRNRRVAVIDMKTGAIKRFFGAYGGKPDDADIGPYSPDAQPARQFRAPVCAEPAKDGTVYVCDRQNDRLQVFKKDGSFLKEKILAPKTLGEGSVWDVAFSRDPQQKYLYVADGQNMRVDILDRQSLDVLTTFGDGGRYPGQFLAVHSIATDSKGNLYTAETYEGKRVQKFTYKGTGPVTKMDQGTIWPGAQR
jgi:DNA-binding beta-propeller fold protein YncE